jgi:hypothetical protein
VGIPARDTIGNQGLEDMEMRAIGKEIGVGLLFLGIVIGIGGYYLASTHSLQIIRTETVTQTTQVMTTVLTSL